MTQEEVLGPSNPLNPRPKPQEYKLLITYFLAYVNTDFISLKMKITTAIIKYILLLDNVLLHFDLGIFSCVPSGVLQF